MADDERDDGALTIAEVGGPVGRSDREAVIREKGESAALPDLRVVPARTA